MYIGISWEEENWRSQYGQVIHSEEKPVLPFPVVHLWDWAVVTECRKEGKDQVTRLVGRLIRRSAKLHPSMPSGRRLLKTAPIRQVHLDLVRVTTGLHCLLSLYSFNSDCLDSDKYSSGLFHANYQNTI